MSDKLNKPKIGITIDIELDKLLDEYLALNNLTRSKYIENLIRKDFELRGYNTEPDFKK